MTPSPCKRCGGTGWRTFREPGFGSPIRQQMKDNGTYTYSRPCPACSPKAGEGK